MPTPETTLFDLLPFEKPTLVPGGYPPELCEDPEKFGTLVSINRIAAVRLVKESRGEVQFTLFLMCKKDPITGLGEPGLWRMRSTDSRFGQDKMKELFVQIARLASTRGEAVGFVLYYEAWLSKKCSSEADPTGYAMPKDDPNAEDYLVVQVGTRAKIEMHVARIQRAGSLMVLDAFSRMDDVATRFDKLLVPLDLELLKQAAEQFNSTVDRAIG